MSKAMVTVEFDEYLELVEFKKAIINDKTIDVKYDSWRNIYTKDEAITKLTNELKESKEMCSKLKDTIETLEHDKKVYREESEDMEYKISLIREYSIWQFLKFRRQKYKF